MNRQKKVDSYFAGKIVWITGASSGIGRGLALGCAKAGARLIISARREELLKKLETEIRELVDNPIVSILQLDITDHTAVERKTEEAVSCYGQIDVLINNAGVSQRSLVKDLSYDVINTVISTDLIGVIDLTLAVLPHMCAAQTGHVVVTSSAMGKISTPYRSAYCAAKFGLHGFFTSLFAESVHDNIDVTILVPGRVRTSIAEKALDPRGMPQGFTDSGISQGETVEKVVPGILAAIAKRKFEYYFALTPLLRIGLFLVKAAPSMYMKLISRIKVT